jgi:hypothetical protein
MASELEGETVDIGTLIAAQGNAMLGGLLVFLAIPCLVPSMGVGYILSLGMFAIGFAMLTGAEHVTMPQRLTRLRIKRSIAEKLLRGMAKVYGWFERVARPRISWSIGSTAKRALALNVLLMAFIIFLPIPAGNTLPAIALLLLGPALIYRDGLFALASIFASIIAVIFTGGLIGATIWAVMRSVDALIS